MIYRNISVDNEPQSEQLDIACPTAVTVTTLRGEKCIDLAIH